MIFRFLTFNHCDQGKCILEDMTRIIGHQMMALGHAVGWTNTENFIDRNGYNVVIESFADNPDTIAKIAEAHARGCRFIYIATEEPTPNGFNHGLEPAMLERQNAFPRAAKFADGILHLIPGEHVTAWYSQFAPSAYAELGYAPTLVEDDGAVEPAHDFGFYGKMTWRREQMLARLEHLSGTQVLKITSLAVPRQERNAMMRRARVILQIRANEEWGMVSSTRCNTAIGFGRPIVAEPHPFCKPWDQIIEFSSSLELFYADALVAARGDWRALHRKQLAKLKETLTPEVCIGRPLREIGIA